MHVNCVICSDIFTPSSEISGASCGHLFHYLCVTQWLERSKTCPQCRARTTEKSLHRVYFNISNLGSGTEDTSSLQNRLDSMSFDMRLKNMELKKVEEEKVKLTFQTSGLKAEFIRVEEKIGSQIATISELQSRVKFFQSQSKDVEKAKNEAHSLRARLKMLQNVETIVKGTADEVDEIIQSYPVSATSINSLGSFVSILKKEIKIVSEKRKMVQATLASTESELRDVSNENRHLRSIVESLTTKTSQLEEDICHHDMTKKSLENTIEKLEKTIVSASEGNLQNRAFRRPIAESPAPVEAKRPKLTNPMAENTTPVRKSLGIMQTPKMPSLSPQLACKSSSVGIDCLRTTKPSELKISKPALFHLKGASNVAKKYSIFNRGRIDNSPPLVTNSECCYDGMGGRSVPDVFPQPRRVIKGHLRKKTRSLSAMPKKRIEPPANTPKLSNFFDSL